MDGRMLLAIWKSLFRLHRLIKKRSTGNVHHLAQKMGVGKSTIYRYLNYLKSFDAPIKYDRHRETYFYQENFSLVEALTKVCA